MSAVAGALDAALAQRFNIGAIVAQHRDARGGAANSTTNKARIADKAVVTLRFFRIFILSPCLQGTSRMIMRTQFGKFLTQPGPLHDKPLS